VLEEFGIMKDNGSFDPKATAHHRDEYYQEVFEQVYQLALKGEASGVNFWAWGGEGRPRVPETWWKKGDNFTGDPPHEPQGWYSVYDQDRSTHKIIKRYSKKLKKLR
jgi:mannan endo-1,4-beta-mannosidase